MPTGELVTARASNDEPGDDGSAPNPAAGQPSRNPRDARVESPAAVPGPALLFCPADRPERFAKAAAAADAVILDLEDAVGPEQKTTAREAVANSSLDPLTTIVRVNAAMSGLLADDLEAVRRTSYRMLMLPKVESADQVAELSGFRVIALCESPRGVEDAPLIAQCPSVMALTWGAEDLTAALGGNSSRFPDGRYRDHARYARSRVLIAAGAAGKPAFDTVHLDLADDHGLRAEAEDAAAAGFAGSLCIHPRQTAVIRSAFAPSDETIAWARRLLAAAGTEEGVFSFEGRMIDQPLLTQAERVLSRARPTF